jgi:hypothetical protein
VAAIHERRDTSRESLPVDIVHLEYHSQTLLKSFDGIVHVLKDGVVTGSETRSASADNGLTVSEIAEQFGWEVIGARFEDSGPWIKKGGRRATKGVKFLLFDSAEMLDTSVRKHRGVQAWRTALATDPELTVTAEIAESVQESLEATIWAGGARIQECLSHAVRWTSERDIDSSI